MTTDFSWNRACDVLGWCSDTLNRAAGWPGIFTPESLAKLQFPRVGSAPEQTQARWHHDALLKALRASIEAGALPVATRTRTVDITEKGFDMDFAAWANDERRGVKRPPAAYKKHSLKKVGERTETSSGIERAPFRDFLAAQGIEPSAHVRAWLAPLEQTEDAHQEKAATNKPDGKCTRLDDIKIEIDKAIAEIEKQGGSVSAATVMARLKERAGCADSCISESAPDGVIWKRGSTGANEKLTQRALKSRLQRRCSAKGTPSTLRVRQAR